MKNYITIDGGTTNTRASLVTDGHITSTVKIPLGARKSIGGNSALKEALKGALDKLLQDASLKISDITAILASGMISSEFGLVNLPHLVAPVGITELAAAMESVLIPELSALPVNFVRGVKTVGTLENTDMMRGEETELMGIMSSSFGECVFVLPGSHSKLIYTDKDGRITHFSTTLTGEMMSALSEGTILKDAVTLPCDEFDKHQLKAGFEYARAHGINEALFKTRILKNLLGLGKVECYSFFFGVILADEMEAIISSPVKTVVLGGKKQFKEAMAFLLSEYSNKNVIAIIDADADAAPSIGMIKIYEAKK